MTSASSQAAEALASDTSAARIIEGGGIGGLTHSIDASRPFDPARRRGRRHCLDASLSMSRSSECQRVPPGCGRANHLSLRGRDNRSAAGATRLRGGVPEAPGSVISQPVWL
jgi:hypothetical protein